MILRIIVNAIAALIGSAILPGVDIPTVWVAILFAIVLGILNATLGNLMKLAGCLVNFVTIGLFDWVVNAIVIILAGKWIDAVNIDGFWPALFLALIMAFVSSIIFKFTNKEKD